MQNFLKFTCLLLLVLGVGTVVMLYVIPPRAAQAPRINPVPQTSTEEVPVLDTEVTGLNVASGTVMHSPFTLTGSAVGTWYFEASFSYELKDESGAVIASGPVTATADWMTTAMVPFNAVISYPTPTTKTGTLVLKNANPSGDTVRDRSRSIPIRFTE